MSKKEKKMVTKGLITVSIVFVIGFILGAVIF